MPVKRPAAKEAPNHTQKKSKPGEDEKQNVALSKEALENHEKFLEELAKKEDMSEKEFSQALAKLPEKQVQLLWKKFEASRKSSDQDKKYKEETNGAGSVAKKKSLLLSWAMDGAKCDKHYKGAMMKLSLDKSHGVEKAWLSKKKCEEELGLEEMKARVSAGTLKWRRNPEDPRFFQFQATTEKEATYLHKQKEAHRKVEGPGSLAEAMAFNQLMDDDDLDESHFSLSQAAPSKPLGLDDGLAAAMGLKVKKKKGAGGEEEEEDEDKDETQDKEAKGNKWDQMSQVSAGDGQKQLKERLVLFKAELTKDLAAVEAALFSIGQKTQHKALVKKVQESQKNGQAALKQVTTHLAGKTGAKTELAKVLTQACSALKDLKSKKQMASKAMKH